MASEKPLYEATWATRDGSGGVGCKTPAELEMFGHLVAGVACKPFLSRMAECY